MSTGRVDDGAVAAARPQEPVRLTTRNIQAAGREAPAAALAATWPLGHPRGTPNPVPAAVWTGPRQPLQACASPGALHGRWPGGAVLVRATAPTAEQTNDGAPADLLDRIDAELHAGRPVAALLTPLTQTGAGQHDPQWLYIVARNYWPDGTVYYLGQSGSAAHGPDIRLYVHECTGALLKPGLKTARYSIDMESRVTRIATS